MLLGGISDLWQREIMGIGPTGRDKGKGGKFLLLPPDHDGAVPDGYMAAKSQTYGAVFGVRGFQSAGGTAQAVSLMKTTRIYPLSQAANPPATVVRQRLAQGDRHDLLGHRPVLRRSRLADRARAARHDSVARTLPARGDRHREGQAVHAGCRPQGAARRRGTIRGGDRAHQQLRFGRPGAPRLPRSRLGVGLHRRVCRLGLAGLRQHRPPFELRLHRHRHVAGDGREARGHRLAVPVDAARCERRLSRRRQALSPAHSAEHPGEELLVGRRL